MTVTRQHFFNDPENPEREVMVTDYGNGSVEMRFRSDGVWGPPIDPHTVESERRTWPETIAQAMYEDRA